MRYVAIYRRGIDNAPVTILKDARIRQIARGSEMGLDLNISDSVFIQIEREGYGYDYYLACAYRALEVEK